MLRRASECVCMTGRRTTFSELEHLFRRQKRDLKVVATPAQVIVFT